MMKKKNHKSKIVLIKKSNNLIESRYKFDIWETRVFLSILGKIQRDDNDFKPYRISYREIIEMWNLPKTHSYKYLREAAKKLMEQTVSVGYEDNGQKREKIYHLIRHVDISSEDKPIESQEYILAEIEPVMKPFLLQLQKNFTAYDLRYITKLGVYSMRIYELLKQYQSIGSRKMNIDNIKEMFEITDMYPLFGNFYQKVIKPSVEEINEFSDIKITNVKKLKEGKKVTELLFEFYSKPEKELNFIKEPELQQTTIIFPEDGFISKELPLTDFEEVPTTNNHTQLENILISEFGITGQAMKQLIVQFGEQDIHKKIDYIHKVESKNKHIENKAGYLMNALKNNFIDAEEFKQIKKQEKIAAKQVNDAYKVRIEAINLEEKDAINARIKELIQDNPAIRDKAFINVRNSQKGSARLLELGIEHPDADVFRKDKILSPLVLINIYHDNKVLFSDIIETYKKRREAEIEKMSL